MHVPVDALVPRSPSWPFSMAIAASRQAASRRVLDGHAHAGPPDAVIGQNVQELLELTKDERPIAGGHAGPPVATPDRFGVPCPSTPIPSRIGATRPCFRTESSSRSPEDAWMQRALRLQGRSLVRLASPDPEAAHRAADEVLRLLAQGRHGQRRSQAPDAAVRHRGGGRSRARRDHRAIGDR